MEAVAAMNCVQCGIPISDDARCGSQVSDAEGQARASGSITDESLKHVEELLREDASGEFTIHRLVGGTLELSDALAQPLQGGPLVSASGALVGVVSGSGVAVPVRFVAPVVDDARRNAVLGQLATAAQVALREKHAYGSVPITADVTSATARISPLEAWQWPGTARTGALPLTFVGPIGRYQLEVEAPELPLQRQEFRIQAATAQRLPVAVRPVAAGPQPAPQVPAPPPQWRGGFPMPLAIGGGAVVVGGLAFLLLGGGGGDGPPPPPPARRAGSRSESPTLQPSTRGREVTAGGGSGMIRRPSCFGHRTNVSPGQAYRVPLTRRAVAESRSVPSPIWPTKYLPQLYAPSVARSPCCSKRRP